MQKNQKPRDIWGYCCGLILGCFGRIFQHHVDDYGLFWVILAYSGDELHDDQSEKNMTNYEYFPGRNNFSRHLSVCFKTGDIQITAG